MSLDGRSGLETCRIPLETGVLEICVHQAWQPLEMLCGFAARDNPRRGFLFVSKVLGKHWPVAPARMLALHHYLAAGLELGPGPWLFVALAETATGLGHGVFDAWRETASGAEALFLHSTRYQVAIDRTPGWEPLPPPLQFVEPHCHAPGQLLYEPLDPELRACFRRARELILIDDEISTGTTLCNLVTAYRKRYQQVERVHFVSITDFSPLGASGEWSRQLGLPVRVRSALKGAFCFIPDARFQPSPTPPALGDNRLAALHIDRHSGRFGVDAEAELSHGDIRQLCAGLPPGARVLVLGTGEYMHPAFQVGLRLEDNGFDVRVAATSRSPVRVGADIRQRLAFADNYGEGILNYLYNVDPKVFDRVIICHETPVESLGDLVHKLGPACRTWRRSASPCA